MTTPEIIAYGLVGLGLVAGAFLVAQRPAFWVEFATRAIVAMLPLLIRFVSRRMTPEQERAFQQCVRRGGEWDHRLKRCRD